jgi:DNA-binding beta-propeller fold protein YncE
MTFNNALGFGFYSSCNTLYYVMDSSAGRVYILNDDWSYVSYKNFSNPAHMITISNSVYMTGNTNIWKFDKDLNILFQYNSTGGTSFRGIYYNSSNGFIYVAPSNLNEIQVFDLNLTYNQNISTAPHNPFTISEYNNNIYVGTRNGSILVIQNEVIINQFNGCNEAYVELNFILFDQYGYMATICSDPANKLYLYKTDGTYSGTNLSTPAKPRYIGFDSTGRFVLISKSQIIIYN